MRPHATLAIAAKATLKMEINEVCLLGSIYLCGKAKKTMIAIEKMCDLGHSLSGLSLRLSPGERNSAWTSEKYINFDK